MWVSCRKPLEPYWAYPGSPQFAKVQRMYNAGNYDTWRLDRAYLVLPAVGIVSQHLKTYVDFPPRQKPGSFNLEEVLRKLQDHGATH